MQKFIIRIDEEKQDILQNLTEECYVLSSALGEAFCRQFVNAAQLVDALVLFYGDEALAAAQKFGADGVVLDLGAEGLKAKMAAVRKQLSKNSVVGLMTRNRRHESMLVSEVEPDFVVFKVWKDGFDTVRELTEWYNDFFLIQSAAWLMEDEIDSSALATDFVIKTV